MLNTIKLSILKRSTINILLLLQIMWAIWAINEAIIKGRLPQPFFYDHSDTLMDFFHTAYWAVNGNMYTEWSSVYPPLNFIICKSLILISGLLGEEITYPPDAYWVRDNGWILTCALFLIYFASAIATIKSRSWQAFRYTDKLKILLIFVLSQPALFALERGNLIIVAPALYSLVLSQAAKKGGGGSFVLALLANIKPYFCALSICYLGARNVTALFRFILLAALIFGVTGFFVDDDHFLIISNLALFGESRDIFTNKSLLSLPSSLSVYADILLRGSSETARIISNESIILASFLVKYIHISLLISVAALIAINPRRESQENLFSLSSILVCNLGALVGGYSQILYFSSAPYLSRLRNGSLVFCFVIILFMPLDLIAIYEVEERVDFSWLSGQETYSSWCLTLGAVLRPIINFILLALALYSLINKPLNCRP